MPFVNIRILNEHSQETKDKIARRVVAAISEEAKLPLEAIWVTFDDIAPTDWYVADRSVATIRKQAQAGAKAEVKTEEKR
jgi:phenylpyruvate tautomerase PptA (4-oxalocrotonate tautomerase family)